MTEETQRCPWCSAELPASAVDTCPSCGAHLTSSSGAEPDIKGVTSLDPLAIIQARADVARPRNRIMSFITGEAPGESEPTPNPESLAPPDDAVRREMLRLELEAERADLEAESVALKTDVIVEQNISLADLASPNVTEVTEEGVETVDADVVAAAAAAGLAPAAPVAPPAPAQPAAPSMPPVAADASTTDTGSQTGV
jgi:hypothetical protein